MANTFYGLNLRWSTNGVTCTAFGAAALIQSIDNEQQLNEQTYVDQNGNTAIWVGYDPKKQATFEYVAAGAAPSTGTLAVTKPAAGTKLTVADSVDAASDLIGSNWIVQSVSERLMSTDAVKITVRAISYTANTV